MFNFSLKYAYPSYVHRDLLLFDFTVFSRLFSHISFFLLPSCKKTDLTARYGDISISRKVSYLWPLRVEQVLT